jgi:beta-lactamase regulating signal transducer with metallopeptidase domain
MNGGLPVSLWPWELATSGDVLSLMFEQLVRASVGGLVLAGLVWAATRLWRELPARVHCALWWAVGLKFLITLFWLAPVELALLPPAVQSPSAPDVEYTALQLEAPRSLTRDTGTAGASAVSATVAAVLGVTVQRTGTAVDGAQSMARDDRGGLPWREGLLLMWLLGVAYGVAGIRREVAAAAALRRRSRPVADPEVRRLFSMLCRRLGVRQPVGLKASDDISVPLTIGWLRPLVLLPASSFAQRSKGELAMALGHELLHVRRLDLWAGWVPRLARCLFFFHPLAVLAAREYSLAREAACDAALLRELGVEPYDYGQLLVRWRPRGRVVSTDAIACAAASSTFAHLKRRLEMLERPFVSPRRPKLTRWIVALVLLAAAVPLRIIAQAPGTPAEDPVSAVPDGSGVFERVVAVDEAVRLDIVTGAGAITVRAGSAGEVRVVGRAEVRALARVRVRDLEAAIRQFESDPPLVVSGNVVRVGYDLDRDLQRYVSISYHIEAPHDSEIHSRTGSGRQEISGVSGPVDANAGSGTILLSDIGGSARVQTGSGSIRADGIAGTFTGRTGSGSISLLQTAAGDVEVATGSGSSVLRGVIGALRARAGSGGITVEGEQAGQPWELHTGSGSVRVSLPGDAGFDLDAQTGSGNIQTDHPVTIQGTLSRGRLSGQVRGGGPALRVRTGSGTVRIQ